MGASEFKSNRRGIKICEGESEKDISNWADGTIPIGFPN